MYFILRMNSAHVRKGLALGADHLPKVCFYHWGKLTKTRLSRGLMVQQVHGRNLHAVRVPRHVAELLLQQTCGIERY